MTSKPPSRLCRMLSGLAMVLVFSLSQAIETADENTLKIGYLSKFPKFVEWPAEAMTGSEPAFHFCVVSGDDLKSISAVLGDVEIKQHHVAVVDARRMDALNDCHVLYIGNSETWRIRNVLAQIKDRPILSVSDAPDFVKQGGIIGLVKQDNRLKFEINLTAAAHAGLRISAQLAKLAINTF